jgi:rRNA small subunit pseudouridine methyltransferase Nep1
MGRLRCFVHTRDGGIIRVSPRARLPRSTERFIGLLEQLYEQSVVPAVGPPLLSLDKGNVSKIIREQNGDIVVALTTQGTPKPMPEVARKLAEHKTPVLLVGGFPEGHFSKTTIEHVNESYRIDRRRLEAWTIVARAIYDYERAIGANRME